VKERAGEANVLFWCLLELEIGSHMSSLARSFSKLIRRLSPFGHVHMSPEARSKGCIKTCQRQIVQEFCLVGTSHVSRGASWQFKSFLRRRGGININTNRKVIIASYARSQSQPASQAVRIQHTSARSSYQLHGYASTSR
jgi:hypothetical protein